MSVLLDTSVVSELVAKRPHASVLSWLAAQDEDTLYLSVLTVGELEKGIARLPASPRRRRLETWVRRDLTARFGARLLGVDVGTATRWGVLTGELPVIDSLIAATALEHDLSVAARNVRDFERCGVHCIDPWEEPHDC